MCQKLICLLTALFVVGLIGCIHTAPDRKLITLVCTVEIPSSFRNSTVLTSWVKSIPVASFQTEFMVKGIHYHLVFVPGFSGRRAVAEIAFVETAGVITYIFSDKHGIDVATFAVTTLRPSSAGGILTIKNGLSKWASIDLGPIIKAAGKD